MNLEVFGYVCLGIAGAAWLLVMVTGLIGAFPFGFVGAVALFGIGALFAKVVRERRANEEDDYYSRNVER